MVIAVQQKVKFSFFKNDNVSPTQKFAKSYLNSFETFWPPNVGRRHWSEIRNFYRYR